jgi:hypothetical protein
MQSLDLTSKQAEKAYEEASQKEDIHKLKSERDALLSALEEIVIEAFDCDVEGNQYCTHDPVQNMVAILLVQHGRMVESETNGCSRYSFILPASVTNRRESK